MQIPKLPISSLYHRFHENEDYNVGEMMEIYSHFNGNSLLTDITVLAREGTDEEIIAYETWRINLYNRLQHALAGPASAFNTKVTFRLAMAYMLTTYPLTLEFSYCVHVLYTLYVKNKITAEEYAGIMGGHYIMVTHAQSYCPYLNRLSAVDTNPEADKITPLMIPEL